MLGALTGTVFAKDGYESLFNGKDLSGWTVKCRPQDAGKQFWSVENGVISCNSVGKKDHDYVWLVSDREFTDFTLRLKFQIFKGIPGNSGVQIRSRYDDEKFWMSGPQVDIHPPDAFRAGLLYDETKGVNRWICPSLERGNYNVPVEKTNPAIKLVYGDEVWNELVIEATGTHVKTTVNGQVAADYNGEGVLNDSFHLEHKVGTTGHIALQLHKSDELKICFKDIEIK